MRCFGLIENYYRGFHSQSFNQSSLKGAAEHCMIRLQSYPMLSYFPLTLTTMLSLHRSNNLSCRAAVVCLITWSRKWKGEDRSKPVNLRHAFSSPAEPLAVTSYEQLNEAGWRKLRGTMQILKIFSLSDLLPRQWAAFGTLIFPCTTWLLTYMKCTLLNL